MDWPHVGTFVYRLSHVRSSRVSHIHFSWLRSTHQIIPRIWNNTKCVEYRSGSNRAVCMWPKSWMAIWCRHGILTSTGNHVCVQYASNGIVWYGRFCLLYMHTDALPAHIACDSGRPDIKSLCIGCVILKPTSSLSFIRSFAYLMIFSFNHFFVYSFRRASFVVYRLFDCVLWIENIFCLRFVWDLR